MILYLFNPSHDEALAADTPYYYPTKIARRLAVEWGMIPAIWAGEGNAVWIADELKPLLAEWKDNEWCKGVRFVCKKEMHADFWLQVEKIEPWGWDPLIRQQLRKAGAPEKLLPTDAELENIRRLSSRETTARLLPLLTADLEEKGMPVVGGSCIVENMDDVLLQLRQWQGGMVKSLWSCSGRGVFHVPSVPSESETGRIARLLREQGAVELEPYYKGVMDFALEFKSDGDGHFTYEGLSLFQTNPLGGYSGNVVTDASALLHKVASRLGGQSALDTLVQSCLSRLPEVMGKGYEGPLGIDMMLAETPDGEALLPCVEVNVRRTMGHVALSLIQLKLKAEDLPCNLRNLWYFCAAEN